MNAFDDFFGFVAQMTTWSRVDFNLYGICHNSNSVPTFDVMPRAVIDRPTARADGKTFACAVRRHRFGPSAHRPMEISARPGVDREIPDVRAWGFQARAYSRRMFQWSIRFARTSDDNQHS